MLTFNNGLALRTSKYGERPVLHVLLDGCVVELATDQPLGVKHSVAWVHCNLVLGRISNQPFCVCKSNVRRCCTVALVIGDDFHTVVLPHADTAAERKERENQICDAGGH